MNCWNILEIGPTDDKRIIKEAYLKKLASCHPEEDPDGFQRLHEAYNEAKKYKPIHYEQNYDWYDEENEEEYEDEVEYIEDDDDELKERIIEPFTYTKVELEQKELDIENNYQKPISKKVSSEDIADIETETSMEVITLENQNKIDEEQAEKLFQDKDFEAAIELCDISIIKYKEPLIFYKIKIRSLLQIGNPEDILQTCIEAISSGSTDIEIYLIKLRIEFDLNLYNDADLTAEKILTFQKDCFEAYVKQFFIYDKFKNYEKIVKIYDIIKELKTTPKDFFTVDNYLIYLTALGRSGKTKEAVELSEQFSNKFDKTKEKNIVDKISVIYCEMQGRQSVKEKKYKLAHICYISALSLDKENEIIIRELIRVCYNLQKYYAALEYMDSLISKHPTDFTLYKLKANLLHERKKYKEAIVEAKKAIELNPNSSECMYSLGVLYELTNDLEEAISCFKKSIELSPYELKAYYSLSLIYEKLKNQSKSEELLNEIIDLADKKDEILYDTWLKKAKIYVEQYRFTEAKEALDNCEKYKTNDEIRHLYTLAKYYSYCCENEKSLEILFKINKINNKEPDVYYLISSVFCEDIGDAKTALNHIDFILKQKKYIQRNKLHNYFILRGKIYEKLNMKNKAKEDFKKALELLKGGFIFKNTKPTSCLHSIFFCEVYSCLGKFDEAEKYYNIALKLFEDSLKEDDVNPIIISVYLAEMYARKGDIAKAIELYEHLNSLVECEKYKVRVCQLKQLY